MRRSRSRVSILAAAVGGLLMLAACSPSSEPITGVGGSASAESTTSTSPDDSDSSATESTSTPTGEPSTTTPSSGEGDTNTEPSPTPDVENLVPLAGSGPSLVDPRDVPLSDQTVPGYEANQLQEAYAWAVDRTVERYAYSNLWRPPGDRAEFTNQSLFFITEYLTGDAEDLVVGSIASNAAFEENQEKLSTLIPQPSSDLSAANWLSPAVSDWKLGEPVFSAVDNGGLQVAVPYSAVGVFEQNGSYYAISIQDVSVYTLTSVAGQWRISQWESQPVFSEPAKLSGKPVDRTLASYAPTDIANDATSNPLDLDSLEPYAP